MGTPSAVSSHRVEGALSPKYHIRANVALRGHRADRIAVSWSCWPPRESTLFTLISQEPNFVARHLLKACKTQ